MVRPDIYVDAIINGEIALVTFLIDDVGEDVNKTSHGDVTPLILAASYGHTAIVELLLSRGAEINKPNSNGDTPLMAAIVNGRIDSVKLLISNGADVNKPNNNGNTPLIFAAVKGNIEIIELLLSKGAEINKSSNSGITPLMVAIYNGRIDSAKLFISNSADVNKADNNGDTPLMAAALKGYIEIIELLLSKGAEINKSSNSGITPLILAAKYRHINVVKLLLSKGAAINQPSADNSTPLSMAASNNNIDVVELLLSKGADINMPTLTGKTILQRAADENYSPAINELIMRYAGPGYRAPSPLDPAVEFTEALPTVFNVALYDDEPFSEAHADIGSIIFKTGDAYFVYPIEQLQSAIADKTRITYACNRELHGAPFVADIDVKIPYFILRGTANYMIPLDQIRYILRNPGSRFYELLNTGMPKEFTASYGSVQREPGLNQSGRPINIVSADHCQAGTKRNIFHLRELRITSYTL